LPDKGNRVPDRTRTISAHVPSRHRCVETTVRLEGSGGQSVTRLASRGRWKTLGRSANSALVPLRPHQTHSGP